jgi:hypothetical protein
MCKRSTPDPLVRTFLDRYNLNLLPLPRSGIECCDLFRRADDGRVSTEFALGNVVTPDLGELKLDLGEHLGALEGTLSHGRDLDFGLGLLGGFLAALGAPGVLNRVGTQYRRSRTQSLAFEFREATRDSVDPGAWQRAHRPTLAPRPSARARGEQILRGLGPRAEPVVDRARDHPRGIRRRL